MYARRATTNRVTTFSTAEGWPNPRSVRTMASPGLIDPGAEPRVTTVIVREFVGQHGSKSGDGQNLKQGQTQPHDAVSPTSRLRHEGIEVRNEIHLLRRRLVQAGRQAVNFGKEARVASGFQARARWRELLAARHQRPQHRARHDHAANKQQDHLKASAVPSRQQQKGEVYTGRG